MLKYYKEHPEFDAFTRIDTATGRLETISEQVFKDNLPDRAVVEDFGIQKLVGKDGGLVFAGETPGSHTRFPRRVYFQITRNCNLNCSFCFIKAECGKAHAPTGAVKDIAEVMGKNGLMEVRLTGGEPTTHPDFLDIMHKFKKENVYVSLATNGVWSPATLEALCAEPHLWVINSVEGNEGTHNKYRYLKDGSGTFATIMGNLKTLRYKNPTSRIRLTTVLTKENKDQVYELGEICKDVGAESITIIPLRPQVRDAEMRKYMVNASEFKEVIEDLLRAKKDFGIAFTTTMETDYKDQIYKDPIVRKRSSCAAGREATNLDYDAKNRQFVVYPCSYSPASDLEADPEIRKPFLAGTFPENHPERFVDIWKKEDAWEIFRDLTIRSRGCQKCEYLSNHQCTGSCPIQNINYDKVRASKNIIEALKEDIRGMGEWYCYKAIDSAKVMDKK